MNLDFPETSPRLRFNIKKLESCTTENIKLNAVLVYLRLYYNEICMCQSSRMTSPILSFDLCRFRHYFQELIRFMDCEDTETNFDKMEKLKLENKYLRKLVERKNKEIEKWITNK